MVLQAYPHGGAHQPEARLALVDHCVPVAGAVPTDVAVHDRVRGATVASCKTEAMGRKDLEGSSVNKLHRNYFFGQVHDGIKSITLDFPVSMI